MLDHCVVFLLKPCDVPFETEGMACQSCSHGNIS